MSVIDKSIGLDDLDFSVRTWKVLKDAGVRTLGDLLEKTPSDLWRMKHMGKKPMQEISDKIREFGVDVSGFAEFTKVSIVVGEPRAFEDGGFWAEIRDDFLESGADIRAEDGDILARVSIGGLRHLGDWENEDSGVIAKVLLSKHGDVLVDYWHGAARTDAAAQEAINEAKNNLRAYFKEMQKDAPEKAEEVAEQVYCLCEEYEDSDAIREFSILAVSTDRDALRKLMEAKIVRDEYGFIKDKGVGEHEADHFITNFDCGFVEYYIRDQKVLSREELEHLVSTEVVSKHISEIVEGDKVLYDDCIYTATSDAYMTKTDNGKEWNFEVEGEGPEEYLYASYFEGGIVVVAREYPGNSLDVQIMSAAGKVVDGDKEYKGFEVERE